MTNKITIEGKVALVSGANRGIGKAITIELLEKGAKKVYAGARDTSKLNDLKEKYGDRLVATELDVTNDESIAKVAETATDVEILIILSVGRFSILKPFKLTHYLNVITQQLNSFF